MDITKTLYVPTRNEWRDWLAAHFLDEPDIWLVSYRVHTGRPSVAYNDAVEEALCFGWIDSTRKGLDSDRYAQRFSPRRPGSDFSQTNKERLARVIAQGMVAPTVEAELGDVRPETYEIPDDIVSALKENSDAWDFFQTTSPAYQRIRAAYVDDARARPADFEKRLKNLVKKSAQGKQFGHEIKAYY